MTTNRQSAETAYLAARLDDEREARKIAGDAADRFRDVLSECLGYADENPGDDVLVRDLRKHFGKTGPEPTRWRDFLTGALATLDQINAMPGPSAPPKRPSGANDGGPSVLPRPRRRWWRWPWCDICQERAPRGHK